MDGEPLPAPPKITIPKMSSRSQSTQQDNQSPDRSAPRPAYARSTTFEGPTRIQREESPAGMPRLTRVPTEPTAILANRSQLRPVRRPGLDTDVFNDPYDDSNQGSSSPFRNRSPSPATSYGSQRSASWAVPETGTPTTKRAAPPPPPAPRGGIAGKKAPPPPPPKRSALGQNEIAR